MSTEAEKDYEQYLEKYCVKHNLTKEEAEKHYLVKSAKQYYEKKGSV